MTLRIDHTKVAFALSDILRECRANDADFPVDVRLQVYGPDDFAVRWGDASGDSDHRGWWGSNALDYAYTMQDLRVIAADLVEQAEDAHAEDRADFTGGRRSTSDHDAY
jgi:hypothetical protein